MLVKAEELADSVSGLAKAGAWGVIKVSRDGDLWIMLTENRLARSIQRCGRKV
jgi:hypothetical protein